VPLSRVRIESFRCIAALDLELGPQRNYVFGRNGAGKTSLLEAIYLLGRGRSFRTRQNRRLIRHGDEAFSVYGEIQEQFAQHRLGVSLGVDGLKLRLNGGQAAGMAALAHIMPVHVIEPNIHQLIEGGPKERRRLLDWGVFHVEPEYLDSWRRYRRVLSQRNAALKRGLGTREWEETFMETAAAVHSARLRYVHLLNSCLAGLGESLLGSPVKASYRSGWASDDSLSDALNASYKRDRAAGLTHVGPHRADMFVSLGARGVREEVSRGQQKLVAAALILAQVRVFAAEREDGGILLVDDPAAELDEKALEALLGALDGLPAQLILTGLSKERLPPVGDGPVFHVEQGAATKMLY
jgi:DNA replication and repair protein RecF